MDDGVIVHAANSAGIGRQVSDGERHMSALAVVVGLAVLREGSEVVLFVTGILAGGAAAVRPPSGPSACPTRGGSCPRAEPASSGWTCASAAVAAALSPDSSAASAFFT